MENVNIKPLSKVASKWAMQCMANPNYIITTSGDYFVLYNLKAKKIVEFEKFGNLSFIERGNNDGTV